MRRIGLRLAVGWLALTLLGAPALVRAGEAPFVCGADEGAAVAPAPDGWTLGKKAVLYMRVQFADQAAEPETKKDAKRKMAEANRFFVENSYGALSLKTKITRTYRLPKTDAEYTAQGIGAIRDDALAAALADGKDHLRYDLDVIQYAGGPSGFGGTAVINGRGCWLRDTGVGIAIHELGHNLGLHHANAWVTSDESVIGPGMHVEYGDRFDTMGPAVGGIFHFNARQKAVLEWLGPSDLHDVTASGSYRIFAHDTIDSAGEVRAIRIQRDSTFDYWLELRQLFGSRWLLDGAGLRRARPVNDAVGTQLLDATPGSPEDTLDSGLVIGRTFSDPEAGIHVTPVGKGGTRPESLDVVVNLGSFDANAPPTVSLGASATETEIQSDLTFEAVASDPDGDALAYAWEFGNGLTGANSPAVTTRWLAENEYVVRCIVSDMKGGTASDSVVVRVGPVTTFRISGEVTLAGAPLEGVHVHNGLLGSANRGSYTDSDGTYVIAGVEAGEHTLLAAKPGYELTPSGFANPVEVGPDATGIDWSALPAD
jgi:hypothetical protein